MKQANIFNLELGRKARDEGMARAAANSSELLELGRRAAALIGARLKYVTIDDVNRYVLRHYAVDSLGMVAGSVFKTSQWKDTGRFTQTKRKTSHARPIKVWEYVG